VDGITEPDGEPQQRRDRATMREAGMSAATAAHQRPAPRGAGKESSATALHDLRHASREAASKESERNSASQMPRSGRTTKDCMWH